MAKVVVITGGSGGIGAALARRLGREGWAVAVGARNREALAAVAADVDKAGGGGLAVPTDVTRRRDVEALRDAALSAFGRVDVWVNNAGRGIGKPVLALTDEDVDDMVAINLKSVLYGMQAIAPHFEARNEGHLVNVSSMLGRVPFATFRSAYSAMKAALNILTANARMDLARAASGVKVSLVLPGPVATEFHDNALHGTPAPPPGAPPLVFQTAEEVADVIADVIAHPVAERYTQPDFVETARRYYSDVGAFEEAMLKRR